MATTLKNLSTTTLKKQAAFGKFKIALVVSEWNPKITHALRDAALDFLKQQGVKPSNLEVYPSPGSFELPLVSKWLASRKDVDAVIALGCVIQGETRHFDFICNACSNGIMQVGLETKKPVVFGVLTTNTLKQASDRAGGKHGNKGVEAAETALQMLVLRNLLR